jgi:hypothetical protein
VITPHSAASTCELPVTLLRTEEEALNQFIVLRLAHGDLERLLRDAGCPGIAHFSSHAKGMMLVALDATMWLRASPQHVVPLLQAIVGDANYAALPDVGVFQSVIIRLQNAAAAQAALPPWDACLAFGVPVVNRSPLRRTLQALIGGADHPLVLVDGASGSGRSHSWHLIKHVASAAVNVLPHKLDLGGYVAEQRTLDAVFDALVKKLQLQVVRPTSVGATPETVAGRYAEELSLHWGQLQGKRVWLVFDSVDKNHPPEIKAFVCSLAGLCLDHQLDGATLFLLGAGRGYGVTDTYQLARLEILGPFVEPELRAVALHMNQFGAKQLSMLDLDNRILAMVNAMQTDGFAAVARKLVELRLEVEA